MLTKLTIRNFKRFEEVEIELGGAVVLIGPNNSGKTSAMQALALWDVGLRRWLERRSGGKAPEKRPGVTVNRRDLVAMPVPKANLLWRDLHTRHVRTVDGRQRTDNVCIDVVVEGTTAGRPVAAGGSVPGGGTVADREDGGAAGEAVAGGRWRCGLEFDYANQESFYCRPLRLERGPSPPRMPVPEEARAVKVAYLPPMSGMAPAEPRLDPGSINVRIGEGRTAEVLRNLCFRIHRDGPDAWADLTERIERLFGVELDEPLYVEERGEIAMRYRERGVWLDLSSGGRGLQQTLLLLAYLYSNPGAVLLLDEPDAHLEILRQREIYALVRELAERSGSQIVAASHSEALLAEAAGADTVIAFVGKPHRIDDGGSQVAKALSRIGFNQYLQAEMVGWVLYLEGSTDLAILKAFARRLGHEAAATALERPFVQYVGDRLSSAEIHFHGLREACPALRGIALLGKLGDRAPDGDDSDGLGGDSPDGERIDRDAPAGDALDADAPAGAAPDGHAPAGQRAFASDGDGLLRLAWRRREIESYLCSRSALEGYAAACARREASGPLFEETEADRWVEAMRESVAQVEWAADRLGRPRPFGERAKATEALAAAFAAFARRLDRPNPMTGANFHRLAEFVPEDEIDPEVMEKLDAIARIAADGS